MGVIWISLTKESEDSQNNKLLFLSGLKLVTEQAISDIPIYLCDSVLGCVVPEAKYQTSGGQFIPHLNAIILNVDYPDWVVVHEYAHGLAYNSEKSRSGFRTILENGLAADDSSNRWLDEYCAMLLEFSATEHKLENRQVDDEMYFTYFKMAEVFLTEIGASEELILKAYYGDEAARQEVDQCCQNRFNCSVFELDDIMLGFNDELREMTLELLQGKPIFYQRHLQRDSSGLEEKYQRLAELFPNFSYKIEYYDNF